MSNAGQPQEGVSMWLRRANEKKLITAQIAIEIAELVLKEEYRTKRTRPKRTVLGHGRWRHMDCSRSRYAPAEHDRSAGPRVGWTISDAHLQIQRADI